MKSFLFILPISFLLCLSTQAQSVTLKCLSQLPDKLFAGPDELSYTTATEWDLFESVGSTNRNLPSSLAVETKKPSSPEEKAFVKAEADAWQPAMEDDFKDSFHKKWFLDGEKAVIKNTSTGLLIRAGNTPASDADHCVLWTRQSFAADVRVEFDFVKRDDATKFVNILYLCAQGSGKEGYPADIMLWNDLRKIPAMKIYFEHMQAYHISFAAFENDNTNPADDYVRARCYLPERGLGLKDTDLKPDYLHTTLFQKNKPYHLCIIRRHNELLMQVKGDGKENYYRWDTSSFPQLRGGRIGLRLMGSRVSEFRNFTVYSL